MSASVATSAAAPKRSGVDTGLEVLRRRIGVAVLVFSTTFTAGIVAAMCLPGIYRARATMLVERPRLSEDFVRSTVTSNVDRGLQSLSKAIMSRSRLEALIDKYGLYADLKDRMPIDEIIERMRGDVSLQLESVEEKIPNSTVAFTISYDGADPQTVALVTNKLASMYVEENLKLRGSQAAGISEFLENQLEDMKKKLDEQERLVKDFKENYIGELPQQENANLATLERLNAELLLNNEKQVRARKKWEIFEKQISGDGDSGSLAFPESLMTRIAKAKAQLAELKNNFTDRYPDVIKLENEIDDLERRLAAVKAAGKSLVPMDSPTGEHLQGMHDADTDLRVLKAEEANLRKTIAMYQERVENTPRREQQFQALQRDYQTTQEVYRSLLKRHEEAKLAESLEQNRKAEVLRVVDPAVVPRRPEIPNRPRLAFMALLASLALAVVAILLAETLDTSFHKADELRAFSKVPVLATVQHIETVAERKSARRRMWLQALSTVLGLLAIAAASWQITRGNRWLMGLFS